MRVNFQKCMVIELRYEGRFTNHRKDPGGRTLEGIIQRVYDGYRARKGKAQRQLTPDMYGTPEWIGERNEIYRAQFWDAIKGDELPSGVDLFVFDAAINSGPHQATLWLQRALAAAGIYGGPIDGHIGAATLAALIMCGDHDALIADMAARRLGMLQSLTTWSTFGAGWKKRVVNCKQIGQAWAIGSVGPMPVEASLDGGNAKAYVSDVAQPAVDAGTATKGMASGLGISGLLQSTQEQLQPFVGTSEWITRAYMTVTVALVAAGVVGGLYALYAERKTKMALRAIDGDVLAELPDGAPA